MCKQCNESGRTKFVKNTTTDDIINQEVILNRTYLYNEEISIWLSEADNGKPCLTLSVETASEDVQIDLEIEEAVKLIDAITEQVVLLKSKVDKNGNYKEGEEI